jgi:hypothetical protein
VTLALKRSQSTSITYPFEPELSQRDVSPRDRTVLTLVGVEVRNGLRCRAIASSHG